MKGRIPVIGVTGPSGAGKSLFCSGFARHGYLILDCDAIYHGMIDRVTPLTAELANVFGQSVISPDGSVDRAALAAVVFAPGAEEKRLLLNKITHAYVKKEIYRQLKSAPGAGYRGCVIDAPLLFEAGIGRRCDLTVALLADRQTRLGRIRERDGLPDDRLEMRLDASPDDSFYVKKADVTIINDGNPEKLVSEADRIAAQFGDAETANGSRQKS